jgi:hypothetical protein
MKRIDVRILFGALLIGAGVLFLLQSLNIIPDAWDILWTAAFLVGGGIFLYVYFMDRAQWWALIPGVILVGLSGTIFLGIFFPDSNLGGALFLGSASLGFWIIYLTNREFWWAIIPGGVLLTLAAISGLDDYISGDAGGGIFFIGLSLTFLLLALLAKPRQNFWWAYIPAGVLFVFGVFITGPLQSVFNYIWPVALILIGGILLFRNIRKSS